MTMLENYCRKVSKDISLSDKKPIDKTKSDNVPVMKNYPNVFLAALTFLPPERETKFVIELLSTSASISKLTYHMAPTELKELKFNCKIW